MLTGRKEYVKKCGCKRKQLKSMLPCMMQNSAAGFEKVLVSWHSAAISVSVPALRFLFFAECKAGKM